MLSRVCPALLAMLIGCRDAGETADPEATQPGAARNGAPIETVEPEPSAPPTQAPAPPPEPFAAEASIEVGGRPVAVRIDQRPSAEADAAPTTTLLVSIDGATEGDRLIAITTGFEACERVKAVIDPVAGEPSPLVLAQAFCENGEDEFSRAIVSAVIDLGDDTSAPPIVTWKGDGSFRSSFGVCVRTDVPLAKVPRPRILVVEQISEVVFEPNPELPEIRCKAKKARVHMTAEIGF